MTDDRLKIWLGFAKWLISTVVVTGGIAWATTIINAKHKDTELKIKINQEEREYLTSFLDRAMDDNLEKRFRFAQYFAHVTTDPEYQSGWKKYFQEIEAEFKGAVKEKEDLQAGLSTKTGRDLIAARDRIEQLEREIMSRPSTPRRLTTVPLYDASKLLQYEISCPPGSRLAIWNDQAIGFPELPEIPRGAYIKYGCRTEKGIQVGRFAAWYENGQLLSEGEIGGAAVLYYPNGSKAATAEKIDSYELAPVIKFFNPDGSERSQ